LCTENELIPVAGVVVVLVPSIESFWAIVKRAYIGIYHHMSPKHLQRYLNELCGRTRIRGLDTIDQMASIVRGMEGQRLRYADLVGAARR